MTLSLIICLLGVPRTASSWVSSDRPYESRGAPALFQQQALETPVLDMRPSFIPGRTAGLWKGITRRMASLWMLGTLAAAGAQTQTQTPAVPSAPGGPQNNVTAIFQQRVRELNAYPPDRPQETADQRQAAFDQAGAVRKTAAEALKQMLADPSNAPYRTELYAYLMQEMARREAAMRSNPAQAPRHQAIVAVLNDLQGTILRQDRDAQGSMLQMVLSRLSAVPRVRAFAQLAMSYSASGLPTVTIDSERNFLLGGLLNPETQNSVEAYLKKITEMDPDARLSWVMHLSRYMHEAQVVGDQTAAEAYARILTIAQPEDWAAMLEHVYKWCVKPALQRLADAGVPAGLTLSGDRIRSLMRYLDDPEIRAATFQLMATARYEDSGLSEVINALYDQRGVAEALKDQDFVDRVAALFKAFLKREDLDLSEEQKAKLTAAHSTGETASPEDVQAVKDLFSNPGKLSALMKAVREDNGDKGYKTFGQMANGQAPQGPAIHQALVEGPANVRRAIVRFMDASGAIRGVENTPATLPVLLNMLSDGEVHAETLRVVATVAEDGGPLFTRLFVQKLFEVRGDFTTARDRSAFSQELLNRYIAKEGLGDALLGIINSTKDPGLQRQALEILVQDPDLVEYLSDNPIALRLIVEELSSRHLGDLAKTALTRFTQEGDQAFLAEAMVHMNAAPPPELNHAANYWHAIADRGVVTPGLLMALALSPDLRSVPAGLKEIQPLFLALHDPATRTTAAAVLAQVPISPAVGVFFIEALLSEVWTARIDGVLVNGVNADEELLKRVVNVVLSTQQGLISLATLFAYSLDDKLRLEAALLLRAHGIQAEVIVQLLKAEGLLIGALRAPMDFLNESLEQLVTVSRRARSPSRRTLFAMFSPRSA